MNILDAFTPPDPGASATIPTPEGVPMQLPPAPIPADTDQQSQTVREMPELSPARAALVKQWIQKMVDARSYWDTDFKRMRDNMKFAGGDQWTGDGAADAYVANITQRHLQQRTASLYAKNPEVACKRRKRLDFAIWDETFQMLQLQQQQLMQMQATGQVNPQFMQFTQDFLQGSQNRKHLDKIAKTLELLFAHTLDTQQPPFKRNMKQLVRRTLATGVGYLKIGFKRTLEKRPEDVQRVNVITDAIRNAERTVADRVDDVIDADNPELETLRLQLKTAQEQMQDVVSFEGLTFDFPKSTSIIVDPACTHLSTFTGAKWIAHEFVLTQEDIQEIYGIDVRSAVSVDGITEIKPTENSGHLVWEVYDKKTGHVFTIMQGYEDFLREPSNPEFFIERFWPIFPLCFNELEASAEKKDSIFPKSDVELLKPIQREYNRSRESLRRHRIANRPRHVIPAGALSDTDKDNLAAAGGNTVIELQSMQPGDDLRQKIIPVPVVPLDPQLYDTELLFSDMMRTTGSQEANIGGTGNATATESSIAESSRTTSVNSNVDDLDDLLTEMARAAGQILLLEVSDQTVREVVGPGAVWGDMDKTDIMKELSLEIKAGSSGRPNKAMDVQNFERLMPFFVQIPGINPEWVAREAVRRLDDSLDFADAWIQGAPSMIAMNAMKQLPPADPSKNPTEQGNNGGQNAPAAQGSQAGTQPQLAPTIQPHPPA